MTSRLLVVDDDAMTRDLLQDVLTQEGFEVRLAAQPDEALQMLHVERFDLIVTDLFSTSYQTVSLDAVRAMQATARGAPIVVLTARSSASNLNTAELGLADIILKPFELDKLVERLKQLLQHGA